MKIGILVGTEETFPQALMDSLKERGGANLEAEFLHLGGTRHDDAGEYDVVLDRISHEVAYYRRHLRFLKMCGTRVMNDPTIMSADDRFSDCAIAAQLGIRVPKTVLLPQKNYPDSVTGGSLRNLIYPLPWGKHLEWVGTPAVLRPSGLKGWRHAVPVHNLDELLAAYDRSGSSVMMLQEAVAWQTYVRCIVFDASYVIVARYDPEYRQYLELGAELLADMEELLVHDACRLASALGYDICSIEFAITETGPVAHEFVNPVPDFEVSMVTPFYFTKIVEACADLLLDAAAEGRASVVEDQWPGSPPPPTGLQAVVSPPPRGPAPGAKKQAKKSAKKKTTPRKKSTRKATPKKSENVADATGGAGGKAAKSKGKGATRARTPRKPPSSRVRKKKA